jgi:hypothetical protein
MQRQKQKTTVSDEQNSFLTECRKAQLPKAFLYSRKLRQSRIADALADVVLVARSTASPGG